MRLIERKVKDNTLVELLAKKLKKKPYLVRYHINKYTNPRWETKWKLTQAINEIEGKTGLIVKNGWLRSLNFPI